MTARAPGEPRRLTFRRAQRLSGRAAFDRVHQEGLRAGRGPLLVLARPNGLEHARLGVSAPRRLGDAVARNAVKRRLREAFRTLAPEMPGGYDLVVRVRPHKPMRMSDYCKLLASAWRGLDRDWSKRRDERGPDKPDAAREPRA